MNYLTHSMIFGHISILHYAYEQCVIYFMGIVEQIVYDQDKLMLVSENHGDLISTEEFQVNSATADLFDMLLINVIT